MLQSVAIYEILNYNLITPASMKPEWFRIVYLGFNALEAVAWLMIGVLVFARFRKDRAGRLQLTAFVAFGASDVFECCGTTPLLLLFKGALLIALLQGQSALREKVPAALLEGTGPHDASSPGRRVTPEE